MKGGVTLLAAKQRRHVIDNTEHCNTTFRGSLAGSTYNSSTQNALFTLIYNISFFILTKQVSQELLS